MVEGPSERRMTLWLKGGHSAHMRWDCAAKRRAQLTLTVESAQIRWGVLGLWDTRLQGGDYWCHTAWTTQSPVITRCWLCYSANAEVVLYCCFTAWTTQLSHICFLIKCLYLRNTSCTTHCQSRPLWLLFVWTGLDWTGLDWTGQRRSLSVVQNQSRQCHVVCGYFSSTFTNSFIILC